MAENTNVEALIRLKPLQNTNYGAIVEEHRRYWKATKDQEEAEKRAREADQQELNRKANKEAFEIYNGLQPEENAGFLNSQIIKNFEKNKPYYMALAKASANGDLDARMMLADEKRKIESIVKVNTTYSEKIKELEKQKSEGTYNEYLDRDVDRFKESILSGKYLLKPDWSLDIYSPALEEEFKESSSGLFKDGIVNLNSSTLFNNDFLNATYSKKAQFDKYSQTVANNILDTIEGNQTIDPNTTKVDAIKNINGILAEDFTELRSFYRYAQKQTGEDGKPLVTFNKPIGDLDKVELNTLAGIYYDDFVEPKIRENFTDNTLDEANKKQALINKQLEAQKKRRALAKSKKEEDVSISVATDENYNEILPDLSKEEGDKFNSIIENGGRAFNIKNGKYQVGEGDKKTTEEVVGGAMENGQLTLLLKKETLVPVKEVPKTLKIGSQYEVKTSRGIEVLKLKSVENDNLTFEDPNDKETTVSAKKSALQPKESGKTKKIVTTRLVNDDAELNAIASDLNYGNLGKLSEEINKTLGDKDDSDTGILD